MLCIAKLRSFFSSFYNINFNLEFFNKQSEISLNHQICRIEVEMTLFLSNQNMNYLFYKNLLIKLRTFINKLMLKS